MPTPGAIPDSGVQSPRSGQLLIDWRKARQPLAVPAIGGIRRPSRARLGGLRLLIRL